MSVALRHSMHRERTALPEQQFLTPYGWACTTQQERKRLIRLITAALCKSTSSHKWNSSMALTLLALQLPTRRILCHPHTVFVLSYLPQIHPLQTPAHAYNVEEHRYKLCPAAVRASSGGCWRGEWNKRMLLESICARSLFWVQPLLFAMMHTSCMLRLSPRDKPQVVTDLPSLNKVLKLPVKWENWGGRIG